MNVVTHIHHPAFSARFIGDGDKAFPTVDIDSGGCTTVVFLGEDGACDALIKAACLAKDMHRAHKHAAAMGTQRNHRFVRPGQVAPDRPAPDRCVACAGPEASHPLPDRGRYDAPSAAAVAQGLPVLDDDGGDRDDPPQALLPAEAALPRRPRLNPYANCGFTPAAPDATTAHTGDQA